MMMLTLPVPVACQR